MCYAPRDLRNMGERKIIFVGYVIFDRDRISVMPMGLNTDPRLVWEVPGTGIAGYNLPLLVSSLLAGVGLVGVWHKSRRIHKSS